MFVSLDLETTGFDPQKDKIIEFGAIKFNLNGHRETLRFFANPGITLPQIITHITHITDEDLKNAPNFEEKLEEVRNFIGDLPIVGHNIQFDTNFLRANNIPLENPEFDTQQMASILLPGLPSYSLEILTRTLSLTHEEKHRALDDSIAAMELFFKLIDKFKSLPPELVEKIHGLCEKTNWPLKNLFKTIQSERNEKLANEKLRVEAESDKENNTSSSLPQCEAILDYEGSAVFECRAPYENLIKDLAEKADSNSNIAISSYIFQSVMDDIPDNIAKIDLSENYISPQRLSEFQNQDFFTDSEFTALLKYTIWIEKTKTGHLFELRLHSAERDTIPKVNIDENINAPENEPFFKKALEQGANTPSITTFDYAVEHMSKEKNLLVVDYDGFIKAFNRIMSVVLKTEYALAPLTRLKELAPENVSVESLIAKTTILFGQVGMIFEKFNDQNLFAPRSTINDMILSTQEWKNIRSTTASLIEISHELGEINNQKTASALKKWKKILSDLYTTFITADTTANMIWIEKDFGGDLTVRKMPIDIRTEVNEFLNGFATYKIIGEGLDLSDAGRFFRLTSGIDTTIPILKVDKPFENISIILPNDIEDSDRNQLPHFIASYFKEKNESMCVILNSRQQLEFFTLKLSKENLPLVSQLTSSQGKLGEQFRQNTDPCILLVTPNTWLNFEYADQIKTLMIHKIPFDPPSAAFLVALSKNFDNPFNELQIPRAIQSLKKMINRMSSTDTAKVVITDNRITEKDYGKPIYKALSEISRVEKTPLMQIPKT